MDSPVSLCFDPFSLSVFRIEALNKFDAEKTRRESALNSLESYVFDVKIKLEDEEEYKLAATENEADSIRKLYTEVNDFLFKNIFLNPCFS